MKKILYPLLISLISLVVFNPSLDANAKESGQVLDGDQSVIVKQEIPNNNSDPIGETGFYTAKVKDVKTAGNIDIYPIVNYKPSMATNDPFEPQGYLTLLSAQTFWDDVSDASSQTVAVIDSGFALNHQDLSNRWATNPNEQGSTAQEGSAPNCTSRSLPLDKSCNNIDDDENGYVDDWRGWDFANTDNEPLAGTTNPSGAAVSHGTRVSGVVGVTGNNSLGASSLNWTSKILPLQVFSDDGEATTVEVAEAIEYAISRNVSVINLSLGTTTTDTTIESQLEIANNAGIIVVASAGNCGGSGYEANGCDTEGQMLYPATSDYVISAGATDLSDNQASFSSRGELLDVMAPGSGSMISSTYVAGNGVSAYSASLYGTSFSSPIVSGLAASLKSAWPTATLDDIRSALVDTALKTSGMSGNLSTEEYGFGRIQPVQALAMANNCKNITLASDINCDGNTNLLDLSLLASQWQKQNTGRTDENRSKTVDLLDLSILASQWGS